MSGNFPFPPRRSSAAKRNSSADATTPNTPSKDTSMTTGFNFANNKIFERMFRRADGVVWDLMTGKIGIQTDDGIVSLEGSGDDAQVVQNLFDDFGMALPAFAQSTPVDSVRVGDIIYRNSKNNVAWVISKNEDTGRFKLMKPNGESVSWTAPKVTMLGFESGVMVLRSLGNMLPNGDKDVNQLQSMLMPMMMMGGTDFFGEDGMESMMPMLLMQMMNGGGANGGINNIMMPMMMMKMMQEFKR